MIESLHDWFEKSEGVLMVTTFISLVSRLFVHLFK